MRDPPLYGFLPMRPAAPVGTLRRMPTSSYAMFWSIGEGPRNVGRVELDADTLSLAPTTTSSSVERIRLRDVVRVLLQRGTLHVERRAEPSVRIGSLDTPGTLRELADRLAASAEVGVDRGGAT